MAQEGHPDALFDVIYADKGKIDSLYAQLFSGLLQNMRRTETSSQGDSGSFNASIKLISGGRSRQDEVSTQTEEDLHPHDIVLIDTLSRLKELGYVHDSLKNVNSRKRFHLRMQIFHNGFKCNIGAH